MRPIVAALCATAILVTTGCGQKDDEDGRAATSAPPPGAATSRAEPTGRESGVSERQAQDPSAEAQPTRRARRGSATTTAKAVTLDDLDGAVTQIKAIPQFASVPKDQAELWVKAVCSARTAGMEDQQIAQMFAKDLEAWASKDAPRLATRVVGIAGESVCP